MAARRSDRSGRAASAVMPEVMNRSMTPSASTIPSAAYRAPDERPDLVDDDLEDVVDRLQAGDRPRRRVEGVDDAGCGEAISRPLMGSR